MTSGIIATAAASSFSRRPRRCWRDSPEPFLPATLWIWLAGQAATLSIWLQQNWRVTAVDGSPAAIEVLLRTIPRAQTPDRRSNRRSRTRRFRNRAGHVRSDLRLLLSRARFDPAHARRSVVLAVYWSRSSIWPIRISRTARRRAPHPANCAVISGIGPSCIAMKANRTRLAIGGQLQS